MFYKIYGVLENFNVLYVILGFAGLIFLANLFVTLFCIKIDKNNKTIFITNYKKNIFIYSFFVFCLTIFCKKSLEITVGSISLLIMFDLLTAYFFNSIGIIIKNNVKRENIFQYNFEKRNNIKPSDKVISAIKVKPVLNENMQSGNHLNVSHINGIIKRLNCFPLNSSEKKQVNDLSFAVSKLEKDAKNESIKSEINDGLNALLKIMAKYSV